MRIKQVSVFLENRPGQISAPCRVLANAGINILTLPLADTQQFGILRLVLDDWEKGCDVLKQAGHLVKITDVIAVEVSHTPGGMASVLELLERNKVNVEYMYASHYRQKQAAAVVFRFSDPDAAEKILTENNIHIIASAEEFDA